MTSPQELSKRLDEIKRRTPNKTCFDCGEKGTTYAAMDFGTFICSRCAGLLRELNFKVKGTGVSIFKEKEIDFLDKMGNENAKKIWMGKLKDSDKKPDPKDSEEIKRFLITKYKDKRYYKKPKKNKDDDDDDEKEDIKKEKNKKKKDDSSSDDDESEENEESESDDVKKKNKNKNNKKKR